ncbi:MAG: ATP-grasp domain-containing protein [Candidatus Brocadiae bacterium]|nr:ATP-grasp domain-containing protein [Candidatus Brocadiia bacterium]
MKVALTYNLKKDSTPVQDSPAPPDFYAECDDQETVDAIRAALAEFHTVVLIEADEDAYERFRSERPDLVFNVAEGTWGAAREAQIPAMLEMLRIPYTGSDPVTLALCLDKARTKEVLQARGIATPQFRVAETADQVAGLVAGRGALPAPGAPLLRFPLVVKPLSEGSSKGIVDTALVRDADGLAREVGRVLALYREPAIVEEYLPGREFTVAMLGNGDTLQVLPVVEIRFDSLPSGVNPIYSYEAKWVWDTAEKPLEIFDCPARIDRELALEIETLCRRTWDALRIRDWARIDVRCDAQGRPHVLEVNPLPGILPQAEQNSCFPKAARAAGLSYNVLVRRVLDSAIARCGLRAGSGAIAPPAHFSLR